MPRLSYLGSPQDDAAPPGIIINEKNLVMELYVVAMYMTKFLAYCKYRGSPQEDVSFEVLSC